MTADGAERAGATRLAAAPAFFASPAAARVEAVVLVDATEATEAGRARGAADATEGGRLVPTSFEPVALMDWALLTEAVRNLDAMVDRGACTGTGALVAAAVVAAAPGVGRGGTSPGADVTRDRTENVDPGLDGDFGDAA